jgi:pimeloyl-ACP methyl ester carboxylesterase
MTWVRGEFGGQYALIVNAGAMVTTRDPTDYRLADGVMVEGYGGWGEYSRFEVGDWLLQQDRVRALINQGRIVILQNTIAAPAEREWMLANYLLIKGDHTYLNLETSQDVEWYPEYDLPIGTPTSPAFTSVEELQNSAGLYARTFSGGLVLINPDPYGTAISFPLNAPMRLVTGTTGGGDVPENAGISGWSVETTEVSAVTVEPGQAAILLNSSAPSAEPPADDTSTPIPAQPSASGLTPIHRSGQTFLTWPEVAGARTYSIYRSNSPLDSAALSGLAAIAQVPQGSGIFWTERARAVEPPGEDQGYVSLRNYVISDLGPQLADGTGLFVWTTHEDGSFYYAVTAANGALIGTTGPIPEQVNSPQAILAWQSPGGLSQVYTQFMDYSLYNPTYDAPRQGNGYLGLPNWEELESGVPQQQYAYNYWLGLPSAESCGGTVPDQLPLILHLEGWGGRYTAPASAPYWCAVMIWGDDPSQSWYHGFSATHDYRTGEPVMTGPIVNYTEERLLRAIHETINSLTAPVIDQNRIYVYGHSMGGTGSLMMAERYPQIFAAASASEPMMNFAGAEMWIGELESKWGTRSLNLPIENRGPDAAALVRYDGTGVWDWENLGDQLAARRGDEMAFISIVHGTQDTVIDWQTVAQPAYANFYAGNRGFIGEIYDADHTWLGFRDHPNWRFDWMTFPHNESFPALAHASGSLPVPPPGVGGYNMTIEWSASNNDFAGPPVDTPGEWAIILRSQAGDQTVDVTPRRLQQFTVQVGVTYTWENLQISDGTVLQSGTVTADADQLITITGFEVSEAGNRLTIRPQ